MAGVCKSRTINCSNRTSPWIRPTYQKAFQAKSCAHQRSKTASVPFDNLYLFGDEDVYCTLKCGHVVVKPIAIFIHIRISADSLHRLKHFGLDEMVILCATRLVLS